MQIEIREDADCKEVKVIIVTDSITPEVNALVKKLSEETPNKLLGFKDDKAVILQEEEICRVYAANGKVFAVTEAGEYVLRLKLYEAEARFDKNSFVRISNSEIVNLDKIKGFDLNFVGTICMTLTNGSSSYVSRRYVSKIKKMLGI